MVTATYGLKVAEDSNDIYLSTFEDGIRAANLFFTCSSILEFFPVLARVPTWLPGTGYLRTIRDIRLASHKLRDLPWEDASKALVRNESIGGVEMN